MKDLITDMTVYLCERFDLYAAAKNSIISNMSTDYINKNGLENLISELLNDYLEYFNNFLDLNDKIELLDLWNIEYDINDLRDKNICLSVKEV